MELFKSYFVNGTWQTKAITEGAFMAIRNPWNGEEVFRFVEPSEEDIANVVSCAANIVKTNPLAPRQRATILGRVSELLAEREEEVARTICAETGKPIRDARAEVKRAVANFRLGSEECVRIHGYTEEQEAVDGDPVLSMTIREPLGVICAITPFNFPLNVSALKIAPALAAGNAVVWKPADSTPMTAVALVDILMEAGLPSGYLAVVLGGARVGHCLIDNQSISLYTFTGSVGVGKRIKDQTGLRPVILELGSNAPNIVHQDADLSLAVETLVKASFAFAGQVCISAQRIYVHEDIWSDFLVQFAERVKRLKVGDPAIEDTDVGPLIHLQAAERVETWVRDAQAQGAKLLTGGSRRGNLMDPIVMIDVSSDMSVVCEEVFGPVVSLIPYRTVSEVMDAANDSHFGLQAAVFTNNLSVAMAIARGLQVGSVNINQASNMRMDAMPYGGVKNSGIGKEGVHISIEQMTLTKVINLRQQRLDGPKG